MPAESEPDSTLAAEIKRFIADADGGDYNELILRLFARQYALNGAYRTYCDSLEMTPSAAREWRDVPAVPAAAFKSVTLSCAPTEDARLVFHSSGTTDGRPGKHFLDKTAAELYRASLRTGYFRCLPKSLPLIALMPPPEEAPHSSLSYMLSELAATSFYWNDTVKLCAALDQAVDLGRPLCVFGTAFALVELFESHSGSWKLPAGSHVVETGGIKGRTRQVSREELYFMIADRLGVQTPFALAEYGMSEMASQFYGSPGTGLTGGHWVRARIIDPLTQRDADEGLLRHYDLANWNSVTAIQTQDIGRRIAGSEAFELLGRAPHSELRGCSLSVEDRWSAATQL